MSEDSLDSVLTGLEAEGQQSPERVCTDTQPEGTLVLSCSMAGCEPDRSLWPTDPSRSVRAVTTLGNQAWIRRDGEQVVNESVAHLATDCNVDALIVVGHTDCSVVADAYERWATPAETGPAGIEGRLGPLVSLARDAADAGVVDASTPLGRARHRLVEYNVVRQVAFLRDALSASVTAAGYVHDQNGAYGSFPGKDHLVAVADDTDEGAKTSRLLDH